MASKQRSDDEAAVRGAAARQIETQTSVMAWIRAWDAPRYLAAPIQPGLYGSGGSGGNAGW